MVTIDSADYCVFLCQEHFPDEFCSKYPPEGVPNKPRAVDDWGTKYNITANMIMDGIRSIHNKGGKVILAYGGTLDRFGITAEQGGGEFETEANYHARNLASRIYNNINDWNLDGVDFFFAGKYYTTMGIGSHGYSAAYHMEVIATLRDMVGSSKSISYSTIHQPFGHLSHEKAIIASCHPYLDYINVGERTIFSEEALAQLEFFGIPFSKLE